MCHPVFDMKRREGEGYVAGMEVGMVGRGRRKRKRVGFLGRGRRVVVADFIQS